jgi:hypothetical protein
MDLHKKLTLPLMVSTNRTSMADASRSISPTPGAAAEAGEEVTLAAAGVDMVAVVILVVVGDMAVAVTRVGAEEVTKVEAADTAATRAADMGDSKAADTADSTKSVLSHTLKSFPQIHVSLLSSHFHFHCRPPASILSFTTRRLASFLGHVGNSNRTGLY